MAGVFKVLILFLLSGSCWTQSDYCSISPQHTMCKFTGTGNKCIDLSARGIDESMKDEILQIHNILRSRVASGQESRGVGGPQPSAANMQVLTWDDELATVAQRWADQCTFQHDCGDCRRVGRFSVGQNLYTEGFTGSKRPPNWKAAVTAWYDEVKDFSNTAIDQFKFSAATGHYTQVAWASTNKVGCGLTTYRNGAFISSLYVCNYGSAGNTIFAEMYKKGSPCSRCPSGMSCSSQFPGLCASGNPDDITNSIPMEQAGTKPNNFSPPNPGTSISPAKPTTVAPAAPPSFFNPPVPSGTAGNSGSKPVVSPGSKPSPVVPGRPSSSPFPGFFNSLAPPAKPGKPGTPLISKDFFGCSIGKNPCRGSFAGSPWKFNTVKDSRNKRQTSDYIETTVIPGKSTEFRIDRELPPPETDRFCLGISLMRELINNSSSSSSSSNSGEGNLVIPPLVIYVQPQNSNAANIRLNNLTSSPESGWLEARVTLRGVKMPFKMGFQQKGPESIQGSDPVSIRLSLNKVRLSNNACN